LTNLFCDIDQIKDSLSLVITQAKTSDTQKIKDFFKKTLIPQQEKYLEDKQKFLLELFAS